MDLSASKSLLDTVLERVRVVETVQGEGGGEEEISQVPSFTRCLYVAEIPEGSSSQHVLDTFHSFVEEVAPDPDEAETAVRGLLLVQSVTVVHFVEAAPEIVVTLLRRMAAAVTSDEGAPVCANLRVVMAVEDCPTTLFQRPLVAALQPVAGTTAAALDSSTTATASLALYQQLSTLAPACPGVSAARSDAQAFCDGLPQTHPKHIPSQDSLLAFCRSDRVMSVEEYLDIFAAPIAVKTSAEGVHPAGLSIAGH
ncbi:unnamed protein product [Symbiodinium sp. KB8]|nr:unnamed protein product [Symbiodinium sp. KB8]